MRSHRSGIGRDDGKVVKRAIKKYGWRDVRVSVLETVLIKGLPKDERRALLNAAEVSWIASKNSLKPNGYNMTPGGDAQPMDVPYVKRWQKKRIKEAMNLPEARAKKRALWRDPEYRKKQHDARVVSTNLASTNDKRCETWARKRREILKSMSFEEGLVFLKRRRHGAIVNRTKAVCKNPEAGNGRDRVAECIQFWDNEIACFEKLRLGENRTLASAQAQRKKPESLVSGMQNVTKIVQQSGVQSSATCHRDLALQKRESYSIWPSDSEEE